MRRHYERTILRWTVTLKSPSKVVELSMTRSVETVFNCSSDIPYTLNITVYIYSH
jgi:hypothetical protein